MKTVYIWLVASMLATATATPAVQARQHMQACTQETITDALAYRILQEASGELEALLGASLTIDGLLADYHSGMIIIQSIGLQDGVEWFRVIHADGGAEVLAGLEDF
jgi:hypothetical protein